MFVLLLFPLLYLSFTYIFDVYGDVIEEKRKSLEQALKNAQGFGKNMLNQVKNNVGKVNNLTKDNREEVAEESESESQ